MKKRVWETAKTLLIVLLFISLLLLTIAAMPMDMVRGTPWLSTVLQPFAPLLGLPEAELAYVEDAQPVLDAAQPLQISVLNSAGRYTAQWDFEALDLAYETLGGLLGQALDTAGEFTEVNVARLPQILSNPSVSFDYGFPLSASLLGSWLEATAESGDIAGETYILSIENELVRLYILGDQCLQARTDISADSLHSLLEQFRPDGSHYAFETESHLTPLALIPGTDPDIRAASSDSLCDTRYVETLATALGFNPYDENRYTDSNGVTYFSETNCSLQIAASGEILLTSSSSDRFHAENSSMETMVEAARSLVQLATGDNTEQVRVYLSGISEEDDRTVMTFDYVLDGIPVACGNAPAARITFSGRAITAMELLAASFTATGETLKVLPPAQVTAIIPATGDLVLQYYRPATGPLTAGWAK